jgi:hypothetical protein
LLLWVLNCSSFSFVCGVVFFCVFFFFFLCFAWPSVVCVSELSIHNCPFAFWNYRNALLISELQSIDNLWSYLKITHCTIVQCYVIPMSRHLHYCCTGLKRSRLAIYIIITTVSNSVFLFVLIYYNIHF